VTATEGRGSSILFFARRIQRFYDMLMDQSPCPVSRVGCMMRAVKSEQNRNEQRGLVGTIGSNFMSRKERRIQREREMVGREVILVFPLSA
jgi:hypothetical protein